MYQYEFSRPSVATDVCVFTVLNDELSVVLIERSESPLGWALPGGFLREDENLDDCARRETEEETGVHTDKLFQFGNFSNPGRDPRTRVISVAYFTLMKVGDITLQAGTDAAKADLFPMSKLPKVLAFDHKQILEEAEMALADTIKLNPLALDLITEPFTLSELQQLYLTLGMKEHRPKGNFYRFAQKVLITPGLIEEVEGRRSEGRQRPAKLYKVAR